MSVIFEQFEICFTVKHCSNLPS